MDLFKNKTVFITGATRGIGLAIGLKLASEGANVVVTGKTDTPHPKLEGTLESAAQKINNAGGRALSVKMDIRNEEDVYNAVDAAVKQFGGIDILINNASAIQLTDTLSTDIKRFDLMHQVNTRGTFLASKACIPHLIKSPNPHILTLSPPMAISDRWFAQHLPYTIAKFGMSLVVKGLAAEFKDEGIGVNALWPRTTIATAAIQNLLGGDEIMRRSRKPEIMADAAFHILMRNSRECTGNYFIDDEVLMHEGIMDLSAYAYEEGMELMPDIFL
jgi:citronellol/citronellal dehydrogenase